MKKKFTKICETCQKEYEKHPKSSPSQWAGSRFCSRPCARSTCFSKGSISWNKGKNIKLNFALDRWREAGGKPWNTGTKGLKKSNSGSFKKGCQINKGRIRLDMRGERNLNWKGGIYDTVKKLRVSAPYVRWKKAVKKRDNGICQICYVSGIRMHVDHVKPMSSFPELMFDVSNGRLLCAPCHMKTPSWGGKSHSSLSEEQVRDIRKMKEASPGLSYRKIAERYKVSYTCISNLIKRKTWNDVI